jgi:hypothetical protein
MRRGPCTLIRIRIPMSCESSPTRPRSTESPSPKQHVWIARCLRERCRSWRRRVPTPLHIWKGRLDRREPSASDPPCWVKPEKHALSTGHCSDYLIRSSCVLDTESACAAEYQSCNKSVASEGCAECKQIYRFQCRIAQEGKGEIHLTLRFKNIPTGLAAL